MKLIEYSSEYLPEIAELFFNTVHSVNAADYTQEQLDAWTGRGPDLEKWNASFLEHYSLLAFEGNVLTGFGDITENGYLDRLYVHKDYQRKGVGTLLCDSLEKEFPVERIETHASITALPFFEHRGYRVLRKQTVIRSGTELVNFVMIKNMG